MKRQLWGAAARASDTQRVGDRPQKIRSGKTLKGSGTSRAGAGDRAWARLLVLACLLLFACACESARLSRVPSGEAAPDPTLQTLEELQRRLDAFELTSEALTRSSLERIAAYDEEGPKLNALITVDRRSLETARRLDRERRENGPRGPLHGIPVILKDNYDTADLPTTGGSAMLRSSRPVDDALVVRRLEEAGAVIVGKANMSELALSYGWLGYGSAAGQTRNPHDTSRNPSGSSSGSAAAVAAGFATLATGTDTAGSIRAPASACGVVGIKPTMGRVSRDGIIPAAGTFDVAGPIARSVHGAAVMLEIMTAPGSDAPGARAEARRPFNARSALARAGLRGVRIGAVRAFSGANPGVDRVFEETLRILSDAGSEVVEVELAAPLADLWPVMGPVVDAEFGPQIEEYLAGLPQGAPRSVTEMIALATSPEISESETPVNPGRIAGLRDAAASGGYDSPARQESIERLIPRVKSQLQKIFREHRLHALVFPTMACPPSPLHDLEDPRYVCRTDDPYRPCYLASASGFPEISVPAGWTENDLPVGVSFLGVPFSEEKLVGIARGFESETAQRRIPKHAPPLGGKAGPPDN